MTAQKKKITKITRYERIRPIMAQDNMRRGSKICDDIKRKLHNIFEEWRVLPRDKSNGVIVLCTHNGQKEVLASTMPGYYPSCISKSPTPLFFYFLLL